MRQWTVDAFASAPFKGNPACVVEPFDAWPEAAWMQALAVENNQAETAFLLKSASPSRYGLRWFTPGMEVKLCGHATLASAHVLIEELKLTDGPVVFDTLSGPLTVRRDGEGYEMDFPADPPRRTETPEGLAQALGVEPIEVWAGAYLVAVLESEAQVRTLTPDISAIHKIAGEAVDGRGNLIVSAFADPGSAHCILAPLYADKLGRDRVSFLQAYPGRGGDFVTVMRGDRVLLLGKAVTTVESVLRV